MIHVLLFVGYIAVVVKAGWVGALLAVVHIAIFCAAIAAKPKLQK